jgi:hypothetical protein
MEKLIIIRERQSLRSNNTFLEGTTRTKEVVVAAAMVVAGVIQMVVVVEVVVEEVVATRLTATNTVISPETIIRGTTILIKEGVSEVVGTLITTMVQQVKPRLMLGWLHDDTRCLSVRGVSSSMFFRLVVKTFLLLYVKLVQNAG